MISVTLPWASMRMNALGANTGFWACAPWAKGRWKPTTKPPPAASPTWRNPRLVSAASTLRVGAWMVIAESRCTELDSCGMFDRRPDTHVGAAPANVSRHGRIDVGVLRMRGGVEQSRRGHDLPRLAVAALDHLQVQPRFLHFGAGHGGAYAFDRCDCALADRPDGQETGAYRGTVHMHGAGSALSDA